MNGPMRKAEGFPTRKWPRSTLCLKRSMGNGTIPFTPQIPEMNQILYFWTDPKGLSENKVLDLCCSEVYSWTHGKKHESTTRSRSGDSRAVCSSQRQLE